MNANRDLSLLHPIVKQNAELFLEHCKKLGYNIAVSETMRSKERQDYLYAQGRTRPGAVVTNAKGSDMSSYHQWGLALDIFQNVKGAEYEQDFLQEVGKIAESFGFEWGGRWTSFKDMPHIQMTFGLSIQELKLGKKVTDNFNQTYTDALNQLVKKGEISQPGLWYNFGSIKPSHIQALIIKFATKV